MPVFPPQKVKKTPNNSGDKPEQGPTSTGKGGIAASLKVKAAGTKNAPGNDKTVQSF